MEQLLESLVSGIVGVAGFVGIIYIFNKLFTYIKKKTTNNPSISNSNKKEKEYKSALPKTMAFICFIFSLLVIQDSENIFVWLLVPSICAVLGYVNTQYYIKKYTSKDNNEVDSDTNEDSTIEEKITVVENKPIKEDKSPSKNENNISDLSDNLTKLGELKEKGLLTEEEFNEQKKKLLKQ